MVIWFLWMQALLNIFFKFDFFAFYINKNEPRCRVITMPLLTTLWVSQLVLFQHHVTADQRAPISLADVVLHDPGMASRQVAPAFWFLSMPFPALSSNLNPNGSGPPHITTNQLLYLFHYEHNYLRPAALDLPIKDRENLQPSPPANQLHISNICNMWQILSTNSTSLAITVWPPCVISILSKSPQIVSCFSPAFCSVMLNLDLSCLTFY